MEESKEAIITLVGFLGAGKTTLLKRLTNSYLEQGWNPFVILNDYENASLDLEQFKELADDSLLRSLSGSCICCSGISELRYYVNEIPARKRGVTLIEANGTSDACSLMGFLGVGLNERFLPPVQISVVDVTNWQRRGEHNELEANQVQVSSLIVLTHHEEASAERRAIVTRRLQQLNPQATMLSADEVDAMLLPKLMPSANQPQAFEHLKAHWSSCSIDLPVLPNADVISDLLDAIPASILRVKGCTRVGNEEGYTFFERTPDRRQHIRPFFGEPTTGPKLLAVGPGSEPAMLNRIIEQCIKSVTQNKV